MDVSFQIFNIDTENKKLNQGIDYFTNELIFCLPLSWFQSIRLYNVRKNINDHGEDTKMVDDEKETKFQSNVNDKSEANIDKGQCYLPRQNLDNNDVKQTGLEYYYQRSLKLLEIIQYCNKNYGGNHDFWGSRVAKNISLWIVPDLTNINEVNRLFNNHNLRKLSNNYSNHTIYDKTISLEINEFESNFLSNLIKSKENRHTAFNCQVGQFVITHPNPHTLNCLNNNNNNNTNNNNISRRDISLTQLQEAKNTCFKKSLWSMFFRDYYYVDNMIFDGVFNGYSSIIDGKRSIDFVNDCGMDKNIVNNAHMHHHRNEYDVFKHAVIEKRYYKHNIYQNSGAKHLLQRNLHFDPNVGCFSHDSRLEYYRLLFNYPLLYLQKYFEIDIHPTRHLTFLHRHLDNLNLFGQCMSGYVLSNFDNRIERHRTVSTRLCDMQCVEFVNTRLQVNNELGINIDNPNDSQLEKLFKYAENVIISNFEDGYSTQLRKGEKEQENQGLSHEARYLRRTNKMIYRYKLDGMVVQRAYNVVYKQRLNKLLNNKHLFVKNTKNKKNKKKDGGSNNKSNMISHCDDESVYDDYKFENYIRIALSDWNLSNISLLAVSTTIGQRRRHTKEELWFDHQYLERSDQLLKKYKFCVELN